MRFCKPDGLFRSTSLALLALLHFGGPAHAENTAATSAPLSARDGATSPNIVLIVADDLGYADLGAYGGKDIPTPHIDSLARNGVRLTSGYVSCPVCSPTRAGLLTGRYQQRFGHEFNPGPAESAEAQFGLPLSETTLASRLKALGYATGMFGKWHLGYRPEFHPQKRGFDEFYGFLGGAHPYLSTGAGGSNPILRGTEPVQTIDYTTDAFAREAVSFIDRHTSHPFFLYLPFNAVHTPLQAPEKYVSRFASITDPKRQKFAAMLSAMDDGIGAVLRKLEEKGLGENTLVVFISDNGGPTRGNTSRNEPLRGFKGDVYEGGIRVPFLVQWKGKLPGGKVYDQPAIALDIAATALAAAGTAESSARLDGVNLLPHLAGQTPAPPHDRLFWRFGSQAAIRSGDWKLVMTGGESPRLFNLTQDVSETKDLASSEPEKLQQLTADYQSWNRELAAPLWQGRRSGRGQAADDEDTETTGAALEKKERRRDRKEDRQPRAERRLRREQQGGPNAPVSE